RRLHDRRPPRRAARAGRRLRTGRIIEMRHQDRDTRRLRRRDLRLQLPRIRGRIQDDQRRLLRDRRLHPLYPLRHLTLVRVERQLHPRRLGRRPLARLHRLRERRLLDRDHEHLLAPQLGHIHRRTRRREPRHPQVLVQRRRHRSRNTTPPGGRRTPPRGRRAPRPRRRRCPCPPAPPSP